MRLLYRSLFLEDVTECAEYLVSEAGGKIAAEWYQSLQAALAQILKNPEIGRLRRDLPPEGIRTFNLRKYPNYLVFYRVDKNQIELLRVRHGMMNLPELFEK